MLHQLPAEIALHTISYLPLCSLYSVSLVSRAWYALLATNEHTVYRNAAVFHRFIDQDRLGAGVAPNDWKAHCRSQLEIERGWRGKGPSVVRQLTATGTVVHRIKVDYELGLVFTTCETGGIFVCDIKRNRVLWALPQTHVVGYAHCEYDRGYIVFDRHDNLEVWRRTTSVANDLLPEAFPPDGKMLEASAQAAARFRSGESRRGQFTAWAFLPVPVIAHTFNFRLSYPTLLLATSSNAYLWDISKFQLVTVIQDIQQPYHGLLLGSLVCVEVNDSYVFICGQLGFRIYGMEDGSLLYHLSVRELSDATWEVVPQTAGLRPSVVQPQMLLRTFRSPKSSHGEFVACHVSASGKDLAILIANNSLVILRDFQRLFAGPRVVHHRHIAITLDFQPSTSDIGSIPSCLAVGGRNGKLAVASTTGVYLISTDADYNRLTAHRPPEPGVSVCRLSGFDCCPFLFRISCLQITHDAVYFTYKPSRANSAANSAQNEHVNSGAHIPLIVDEGMQDGFADTDSEGDDPAGANDPHNRFVPRNVNTVYSVSF